MVIDRRGKHWKGGTALDLGEMIKADGSAMDEIVSEVAHVACGSCTGSVFRFALDDDDEGAPRQVQNPLRDTHLLPLHGSRHAADHE